MTWAEIGLLWVTLSVIVPVLFGLRRAHLQDGRDRSDPV